MHACTLTTRIRMHTRPPTGKVESVRENDLPRAVSNCAFSAAASSGRAMKQRHPYAFATIARLIPALHADHMSQQHADEQRRSSNDLAFAMVLESAMMVFSSQNEEYVLRHMPDMCI